MRLYPDPDISDLKNIIAEKYKLEIENIFIGNGTIINCNVTILDTNRVEIGDNVFIAPGVVISAEAGKWRLQA